MEKISETAARFGIDDDMPPLLANSLGATETTVLKLTLAYAQLVNGGKQISPIFIDRVQDRLGSTVSRSDERACVGCGNRIAWQEGMMPPHVPDTRAQVADPRHAYQIVSILEGVVQRGTGVRIRALGYPLAGKTGTTNESKDAWFVGFAPDLAVGVYVGFDTPRTLGSKETGSSVAVPIFKDFMEEALDGAQPIPFRMPSGISLVQVNAKTGTRARSGDSKVIWEAFLKGQEPGRGAQILGGGEIRERRYDRIPGASTSGSGATTVGTGGLY
jgi:penicillin-binding protein 1A